MAATWVFGYGSLVYRPGTAAPSAISAIYDVCPNFEPPGLALAGFDFSKRVEGCIRGYQRVFHQGSTDHRGTPEYPGRTVTLRPCPNSIVVGTYWHGLHHVMKYCDTTMKGRVAG